VIVGSTGASERLEAVVDDVTRHIHQAEVKEMDERKSLEPADKLCPEFHNWGEKTETVLNHMICIWGGG